MTSHPARTAEELYALYLETNETRTVNKNEGNSTDPRDVNSG